MSPVRAQWLVAAACVLMAAATLVVLPPERYAIYPACPFRAWLGLTCPGCGFTRALAALLSGRFEEAVRYNAMVFLLFPGAVSFALVESYSALVLNRWLRIPKPQLWLAAISSTMLLFGLFRNLQPLL